MLPKTHTESSEITGRAKVRGLRLEELEGLAADAILALPDPLGRPLMGFGIGISDDAAGPGG